MSRLAINRRSHRHEVDGGVFPTPFAPPTKRSPSRSTASPGTWRGTVSVDKFEDDLLRQNSLVHQNGRIFRWTDRQLQQDPERVKEELALFLQRISGLFSFDDFLPQQLGDLIDLELRPHQKLDTVLHPPPSGAYWP